MYCLAMDFGKEFSIQNIALFNHAGYGRVSKTIAIHQADNFIKVEAAPSKFFESPEPGNRIDLNLKTRQAIGRFVGADAERIALVPNATFGLNMVANTLVQRQAHVVGTSLDYGGVEAMWKWHTKKGLQYDQAEIDVMNPSLDKVRQLALPDSFVVVPHIASTTATFLDVFDFDFDGFVVVDGAQAVGQVPLNLEASNIDVYVGVCHKWISAPRGTAFVWVSKRFQDELEPLLAAVTTTEPSFDFGSKTSWLGTHDPSAWMSIPKSIDFFERNLLPFAKNSKDRLARATAQLEAVGCQALPHYEGGLLASFLIPKQSEKLKAKFYENNIEMPVLDYQGQTMIRLSMAWYVDDDHVQRLIDCL